MNGKRLSCIGGSNCRQWPEYVIQAGSEIGGKRPVVRQEAAHDMGQMAVGQSAFAHFLDSLAEFAGTGRALSIAQDDEIEQVRRPPRIGGAQSHPQQW